jgi:hypothetical protein
VRQVIAGGRKEQVVFVAVSEAGTGCFFFFCLDSRLNGPFPRPDGTGAGKRRSEHHALWQGRGNCGPYLSTYRIDKQE